MNQFNDIKHSYEAMERILRQLEAECRSTENDCSTNIIEIPTEVIIMLEESKSLNDIWNVHQLLRVTLVYTRMLESIKQILRAPHLEM